MEDRYNSFTKEQLFSCGNGELFGNDNAKLPMPPMLMFDRIVHISDKGGEYGHGEIIAELDVLKDLWFFDCHFIGDPVMPGCLGLDAMWQLVGFYMAWIGGLGYGRALGAGAVRFSGQVTPEHKLVTYKVSMRRIISRTLMIGIADACMSVDNNDIYWAKDLRVGLFQKSEGLPSRVKN